MGWMIQEGGKNRRMTWAELAELYIKEGHRTALYEMATIMRKQQRGYKTDTCYKCRRDLLQTGGDVFITRLQSSEVVYTCEDCKVLYERLQAVAKERSANIKKP